MIDNLEYKTEKEIVVGGKKLLKSEAIREVKELVKKGEYAKAKKIALKKGLPVPHIETETYVYPPTRIKCDYFSPCYQYTPQKELTETLVRYYLHKRVLINEKIINRKTKIVK